MVVGVRWGLAQPATMQALSLKSDIVRESG